jgi:uncharacterized protein YacL (UPF0231 family)
MINWIKATKENLEKHGIIKDLGYDYYQQRYGTSKNEKRNFAFLRGDDKSIIVDGEFVFSNQYGILAHHDTHLSNGYALYDEKEFKENQVTHFALFEDYMKILEGTYD